MVFRLAGAAFCGAAPVTVVAAFCVEGAGTAVWVADPEVVVLSVFFPEISGSAWLRRILSPPAHG